MRIAYFAHLNDGHGSGVVAKIAAQLDQWRREGHQASIFLATKDADTSWVASFGQALVHRYEGPTSRLRAMRRVMQDMHRFQPNLIYVRWDLFYPPMLWLPRVPLVAEVNTDDLAEDLHGTRLRASYNRLTRRFWLRRAAGLVFVTKELSLHPSFRRSSARRAVITNGVDLASYPVLGGPSDGPRRLIFVGTGDVVWHGVDKVIRLALLRPAWRIDVVGVQPLPGSHPANITWHPPLDRRRLLNVMAQADVGVGTLALHRKGLNDGSPLKVREYLAVGLPVLYGYRDEDADHLGRYVLRIANTETSVEDEIERIDAFVTTSRGLRVPRSSVGHIDTTVKEGQRLALFDLVVGA